MRSLILKGEKNAAGILSVLKTQEDREEFYSNSSMKRMKRKSNDLHLELMEAKHHKIIQNMVTIQVFENGYFHFERDLSKSSTLGTLTTSCAEHIGVPPSWIGLLYNDRKIDDNDTPELLAMKQFNKIELQKFGWIPIKISDHILDRITPFNVKMTTTIEQLKKAYLDSIGVPESLNADGLTFKDELISGEATLMSLGMVQNDVIEIGQEATMTLFLISDLPDFPDVTLNIRRSATMLQVKQQFVKKTRRHHMNPWILTLVFREQEVENEDTPGSLWMTNNETVWVYLPILQAEAA